MDKSCCHKKQTKFKEHEAMESNIYLGIRLTLSIYFVYEIYAEMISNYWKGKCAFHFFYSLKILLVFLLIFLMEFEKVCWCFSNTRLLELINKGNRLKFICWKSTYNKNSILFQSAFLTEKNSVLRVALL